MVRASQNNLWSLKNTNVLSMDNTENLECCALLKCPSEWKDEQFAMSHVDALENIRFWNHGRILFCEFAVSGKITQRLFQT